MAASTSLDSVSPPPSHFNEGTMTSMMGSVTSPPMFSPLSDKRFWSNLRCRIDSLLEDRSTRGEAEPSKRMKEDSTLLLRGFDSIAHTLSQLSDNIDNALQGARDLAKPPTLTDIFHSNLKKSSDESKALNEQSEEEGGGGERKTQRKRKLDTSDSSEEDHGGEELSKGNNQLAKLKKAKNLAVSMATKAASLARELKSIKSDLSFMQERCALLEEENARLRDGITKGVRPEEDDLVRLQLETLLAEKSRLANENANLIRENQCLNHLVAYHQLTSQDLSESYEQVIKGMCLDFSSPPPPIAEGNEEDGNNDESPLTPGNYILSLTTSLDQRFQEEEHL